MRAIILAAGRGSRMGGLTEEQPKCLTPFAGRTLLEWQLDALRAAAIRDIAVVRGYRAETINPAGCIWFENSDWASTNMVATLACACQWLVRDDCIVSYSDIVYHPSIVERLSLHPGEIVISYDEDWLPLWSERFENPLDDAETFRLRDQGRLRSIGARARTVTDIEGQYMGLLKISPAGWHRIESLLDNLPVEQRRRLDMTSLLQLLLKDGADIHTVPTRGRWCEVDSETDLRRYEDLLHHADWQHDWRWETAVTA